MLERYWIVFCGSHEEFYSTGGFDKGFGVTAYDIDDAKRILKGTIFGDQTLPEVDTITEGITYEQLEENHVKPNMGNMAVRGVWFPKVEYPYTDQ